MIYSKVGILYLIVLIYVTDWRQYGMNTVLIFQADIQEHAINKYRSVEGHVELLINECTLSFYMFAFAIMKSNE